MRRVREYVVGLAHRPGTLAQLTGALAADGVNLLGVSVEATEGVAFARLLVDPAQAPAAAAALERGGFAYATGEALAVQVPNRPGALGDVSARIARAGVNIEGVYGFAGSGAEGQVVIRADDLAAAERALRA